MNENELKSNQNSIHVPKLKWKCCPVVLVAEDNLAAQLIMETVLKELGCNPIIVPNGEEVLNKVKNEHIDLIFMDCRMDKMNGYEATYKLRKNKINLPIIALSAYLSLEHELKWQNAGMNEQLTKPIDIKSLSSVLCRHLQHLLDKN